MNCWFCHWVSFHLQRTAPNQGWWERVATLPTPRKRIAALAREDTLCLGAFLFLVFMMFYADMIYCIHLFFPVAYNITCCHTRCIPTTSYNIIGSPDRLLPMVRSHDRLSCLELRRHCPATCASPTPKEGKIYASENGMQTVLSVLSIIDLTICCGLWIGPSRNHSHLMPPPPYLDGV